MRPRPLVAFDIMNMSSHRLRAVGAAAAAAALLSVTAGSALASPAHSLPRPHGDAVFVLTDATAGNAVVAYDRATDGTLTQAQTYATGGRGGVLDGAVVDNTASQGALTYDRAAGQLYAVNPGSDTITTFGVSGDRLQRRQILPTLGRFPVSIAAHGNLVYVLNARDGGSIQGYRRVGPVLIPIPAWHRDLGLDASATPEFTHTPGQVAFSPDGHKLVVTTKANTNAIEVYDIDALGGPSAKPTTTTLPDAVPFGVSFDATGRLAVAEAGPNAVATFVIDKDDTLIPSEQVPTGQAATCWIITVGTTLYASNAGSATLTEIRDAPHTPLSVLGNAAAGAGTVDAAATPDGRFVYAQGGAAGTVTASRVAGDGTLTAIDEVTVPGAPGAEGIVAP
jgi:6-phosphogluconolactonase (cycloisomerase 2 family)